MKLKTQGVAPKAVVAALLPLLTGVVLLALDKLALGDSIDDAVWLAAIGLGPVTGGAAVAAPAAPVAVVPRRDFNTETGQSLVGVVIAVLLAVLLAALAYWLAVAVGLPSIVGVIAAIIVLLAVLGSISRF